MKSVFLAFLLLAVPFVAAADEMASTDWVAGYVNHTTQNKVDVSETANQTMAGTYTVSGTLIVPTPPLPSAQ